jgi:hypothetical protein
MSSAWLGVIASLGGVIIGAIATYLSQAFLWKRTTRRELYGSFVGRSNVCRDEFLDVAYAIRRELPERERNERWGGPTPRWQRFPPLAAQVSMVATMATWNAAEAFEGNLSDLRTELHKRNREGTTPTDSQEYRDSYSAALRNFTAAAGKELGIARTPKRIPRTIK